MEPIACVTRIATKQDLARWTRAHADTPGINWSVQAGPGGTMIIVEREAAVTPGIRNLAGTAVAA
jgi:hypothetical protein